MSHGGLVLEPCPVYRATSRSSCLPFGHRWARSAKGTKNGDDLRSGTLECPSEGDASPAFDLDDAATIGEASTVRLLRMIPNTGQ
jgi:hypothetical protein